MDSAAGDGCFARAKGIEQLPERSEVQQFIDQMDPGGRLRQFAQNNDVNFITYDPDSNYSIGFEKNPWVGIYTAVRATSRPRQLFFPIGGNVTLTAVGYAKPFGGRIGPWYKDRWPATASYSTGTMIDPLLPDRREPGSMAFNNSVGLDEKYRRLPNYSRYPGDPHGLTTYLAQTALNGITNIRMKIDNYKNIGSDISEGAFKDILIWDYQANTAPAARNYELAAIQPDLYDLAYYSIVPNFSTTYLPRIRAAKNALGIPNGVPVRGDLGERWNGENIVNAGHIGTTVDAMTSADLIYSGVFWTARQKAQLLTSWLPGQNPFDYSLNAAWFGKCAKSDDDFTVKTASGCVAQGGRSGYSVKVASRSYFFNRNLTLGGPGEAVGGFVNPPPSDGGW